MSVVRIWPRGRPRHPDILTPAEWRVAAALRGGGSNAEIAAMLGVSVNTVRMHVSHILTKLELPNRRAIAHLEVSMAPGSTAIRLACSFCRKNDRDVELLIAGPAGVHICGSCVEACNQIIAEHRAKAS
jgi:DNA-binding CsgD family transcriptional regulator